MKKHISPYGRNPLYRNLQNFSDLRYNKIMCEHVYKDLGPSPCPKCGGETHSINWQSQYATYKEYKEKINV